MNFKLSIAALALLSGSFAVSAQNNWYVGLDVHSSKLDLDSEVSSFPTISSGAKNADDSGAGLSIMLGRKVNEWLAIEANLSHDYIDLLDYSNYYDIGLGAQGYEYQLHDARIYSFDLGAKMSYATGFDLNLYAKPGIGYTRTELELNGGSSHPDIKVDKDVTNNKVHFNLELGAEYFFTDSFSANLAYERKFNAVDFSIEGYKFGDMDQDRIKGGVRYYF